VMFGFDLGMQLLKFALIVASWYYACWYCHWGYHDVWSWSWYAAFEVCTDCAVMILRMLILSLRLPWCLVLILVCSFWSLHWLCRHGLWNREARVSRCPSGPVWADSPWHTPTLSCIVISSLPATCPVDCTILPVSVQSQAHSRAFYTTTAATQTCFICTCLIAFQWNPQPCHNWIKTQCLETRLHHRDRGGLWSVWFQPRHEAAGSPRMFKWIL
jgi:hypothetical protein